LKNEKKFGKNHEYFHEKIHIMKAMSNVHLDNASRAHKYYEGHHESVN